LRRLRIFSKAKRKKGLNLQRKNSFMTEIGKYIYGIINSNTSLHLFIPTDFLVGKSESNGVYTIPYQDISALVRDSEIVDYTHMRKDISARLLVGHQTVIERIMTAQDTIIPMRLGIYALDESEVKEILNKGYNLIKHIFEKLRGKIEIDVAATWSDFNSMMKEMGEEKEIKEFKERLLADRKGISVDDQMKIGLMLKKALDKRREEFAKRILERLRDLSEDTRSHELMDDNMVLNSAFLINKAKHKDFEIKVEELNIEFAEKLNFRCVGPLPPYSFYTLQIKKLKFEEIDWARRKLALLNDFITKDEIKKAYHTLVFSCHPDKNPNTPGIEKEFDEVTKAYNLLWEYCQKDSCSFKVDEFKKNAILVRLRG
jgi:hypothetical protein